MEIQGFKLAEIENKIEQFESIVNNENKSSQSDTLCKAHLTITKPEQKRQTDLSMKFNEYSKLLINFNEYQSKLDMDVERTSQFYYKNQTNQFHHDLVDKISLLKYFSIKYESIINTHMTLFDEQNQLKNKEMTTITQDNITNQFAILKDNETLKEQIFEQNKMVKSIINHYHSTIMDANFRLIKLKKIIESKNGEVKN